MAIVSLNDTRPGPKPDTGDLILCGSCGEILEVGEANALRIFTQEEFDKLDDAEQGELLFAQRAIRAHKK